jgi:hypothetical protein
MPSEDGIHIDCCFVVFVIFPFGDRWKSVLFCRIVRADAQGAVQKSHHKVSVEPVLASALVFHIQYSTVQYSALQCSTVQCSTVQYSR